MCHDFMGNEIMNNVLTGVFIWAKFRQLADEKTAQCDLYKVFIFKKHFKKFAIFLRPKNNSPDLDSEFV
jgi:hypothetical protein